MQEEMPYEPCEMLMTSRIAFDDFMFYSPILNSVPEVFFDRCKPFSFQYVKIRMPDVSCFMVNKAVHQRVQNTFIVNRKRRKEYGIAVSAGGIRRTNNDLDPQLVAQHRGNKRHGFHRD